MFRVEITNAPPVGKIRQNTADTVIPDLGQPRDDLGTRCRIPPPFEKNRNKRVASPPVRIARCVEDLPVSNVRVGPQRANRVSTDHPGAILADSRHQFRLDIGSKACCRQLNRNDTY